MASLPEELSEEVKRIARSQWSTTEGRVVPESEDVGLGNVGVEMDVTMLYSDLADSTEMAMASKTMAAEVYKAFLLCCSRIIKARGGHIRSFDGDRVMGVFIGDSKNSSAGRAALNINYAFAKIIVPAFKEQYRIFKDGTLALRHCTGIDTGTVLIARAGIRSNNDLVWVGRAPNVAAKLSARRHSPFYSYATASAYRMFNEETKLGPEGKAMWEPVTANDLPADYNALYRSSWYWSP